MGLIKTYYAGAEVNANRFVKLSADNAVVQASANTDLIIGVSINLVAASGQPVDVVLNELATLKLAGSVVRGDKLTSDASGYGVKLSDAILAAGAASCGAIALQNGSSGDIIDVLVVQQRVSKTDVITASVDEIEVLKGAPMDATITVGADAGTTVAVAIQLKDADGDDLAVRGSVFAYLSDDANGDSIVGTPPSSVAIGTDGLAIQVIAASAYQLVSEVDGDIDLVITKTGADVYYLVLVMPNGKLVVSDAITFTV